MIKRWLIKCSRIRVQEYPLRALVSEVCLGISFGGVLITDQKVSSDNRISILLSLDNQNLRTILVNSQKTTVLLQLDEVHGSRLRELLQGWLSLIH